MEVNENYYGLKENWFPVGGTSSSAWQSQIPDDEKFKLANFLNNTQSALQSDIRNGAVLGNAIYKAYKTDSAYYDPTFEATLMGKVFDESIEFAGMSGDYCPYSRIMYFSNRREQDQGSTRDIVSEGEELIDVWNYFFTAYMTSITNGYGNYVKRWDGFYVNAPSSPSGTYGYEFTAMRWMPADPQDSPIQIGNPSSSYPYYYTNYATRNQLTFITQFPCRRTVLVPTITCSDDALNPTNVRTYDLYTYLNEYKETRPIVWSIQFTIYTKNGASDLPTVSDKRAKRTTMIMASNTPLKLQFTNGSPYVQTMAAGGTLVNESNPFMVPQILPTGSNCTPLGGPINVGLGANMNASDLWEITAGNSYDNFSVWAVINCGVLEFNNWTSRTMGSGTKVRCYCNANDYTKSEFREAVRHAIACFGMFFTDSMAYAETAQLDDDTMHLGVLVNGVGYGEYTSGDKNTEQPQFGWKTMNESDYDPSKPPIPPSPFIPDPNGYTDGMDLAQLDGFETATQRYNLYKAQAHQVFAALWSVWDPFDESDPDLNAAQIDLKTKKMFLTNNPLDCVIGLKYFPVPADMIGYGSDTPVKLGALTLHQAGSSTVEIQCKMAQNSYIHDCGSVYCAPQYQAYSGISDSWIDQYVGFELYLPFCGSVKLDTATYIGKWVNVQYHIDYITGACTAYIGIPSAVNRSVSEFMEIRSGNCAIDVPISGIQQATLEANMFNATQQLKGAALKGVSSVVGNLISTAGKAAAKDIAGAVSAGFSAVGSIAGSVNEIQSAKFELQHTQLPARMIGSASALSGAEGYLSPMLIVTEPRLVDVPDNYGHTVGFACMQYGKLKDISSGYTEINSIDLDGIACTAEEKSIIRSVLAGGIYL